MRALALGDARLAARLASDEGGALRRSAEDLVRSALAGTTEERPWIGLLGVARAAGTAAGEEAQERMVGELELLPSKERKRYEREGLEARRRGERRVRTQTLDLALRLAELWLRDVLCICEGAAGARLRGRPPRVQSSSRTPRPRAAMAMAYARESSWWRKRG